MSLKPYSVWRLALVLFALASPTSSQPPVAPRDIKRAVVFTMAEPTDNARKLDLARQAHSEVLVRGWFKWREARPIDPLRALTEQAHAMGALFGGGITCSALYDGENGITREQLLDMATRGPDGNLVDAWGQRGIRHGSLSSPAYQDYLFRWCREQIDAGVDTLFMDEINAALRPNEGYDDYSLADFRRYLSGRGQSTGNSPLSKIDLADRAICPDGTLATFDYRAWLRAHGFLEKPVQSENPLNPLWQEFRKWRDDRAWKALTERIRAYAAGRGRRVLLSGNGLARYVDLQVLGVWGQWSTEDGHIDLRENKIPYWREQVRRGRVLAGRRVPVVLFHDWGFGTPMFPWMAVPPREREVWMRTGGAEIYAAGAFFAFPVLGPAGCDAGRDGTLPAIARQAAFYQAHRALYLDADSLGSEAPQSATPNLSLSVGGYVSRSLPPEATSQTLILHAINRNIIAGELHPQKNVIISLPLQRTPERAIVISPDFATERPAACRMAGGRLEVSLGDLDAYAVALLTFKREIGLDALRDPARTLTIRNWNPSGRSEFRILPDGSIENAEDLNGMLQGKLHKELRNPPTFLVNATRPGVFEAHVRAVATLGAHLEWLIDGQPSQAVDLPDLDQKNANDAPEYNKTFSFPIPPGRHRLTLDNTGGDWASLDWISLTGTFS